MMPPPLRASRRSASVEAPWWWWDRKASLHPSRRSSRDSPHDVDAVHYTSVVISPRGERSTHNTNTIQGKTTIGRLLPHVAYIALRRAVPPPASLALPSASLPLLAPAPATGHRSGALPARWCAIFETLGNPWDRNGQRRKRKEEVMRRLPSALRSRTAFGAHRPCEREASGTAVHGSVDQDRGGNAR